MIRTHNLYASCNLDSHVNFLHQATYDKDATIRYLPI